MKNDLRYAEDTPTGICMAYGGQHECEKWPELFPSPCCWLSCTELCGAACWRGNLVAERCELYKKGGIKMVYVDPTAGWIKTPGGIGRFVSFDPARKTVAVECVSLLPHAAADYGGFLFCRNLSKNSSKNNKN